MPNDLARRTIIKERKPIRLIETVAPLVNLVYPMIYLMRMKERRELEAGRVAREQAQEREEALAGTRRGAELREERLGIPGELSEFYRSPELHALIGTLTSVPEELKEYPYTVPEERLPEEMRERYRKLREEKRKRAEEKRKAAEVKEPPERKGGPTFEQLIKMNATPQQARQAIQAWRAGDDPTFDRIMGEIKKLPEEKTPEQIGREKDDWRAEYKMARADIEAECGYIDKRTGYWVLNPDKKEEYKRRFQALRRRATKEHIRITGRPPAMFPDAAMEQLQDTILKTFATSEEAIQALATRESLADVNKAFKELGSKPINRQELVRIIKQAFKEIPGELPL